MVQRLHYRRRLSYNTPSNKVHVVRTPGAKLTYHYTAKRVNVAKCGDCGLALRGLPALPSRKLRLLPKCQRTISRAYGASRCHDCVKSRILRAFLIEEQKIVKTVLRNKSKAEAAQAAPK